MKFYQDLTGERLTVGGDVYRDRKGASVERFDAMNGWTAVDWGWWVDRIEQPDPTLEEISEAQANAATNGSALLDT